MNTPVVQYTKGAPDVLLPLCDRIWIDGRAEPMTDAHISELNAEYAMLLERKKSSYAEYRKTKSEMQDWLVAQKIVQKILKEDE